MYFPYGFPNVCSMTYHPMLELVLDNRATFLRMRCSLSHRQVASDVSGNFRGSGRPVKRNVYIIKWPWSLCSLSVLTQNVWFVDPWEGSGWSNVYKLVKWTPEGQLACGHTVVSGPCQIYARSRQFVDLLVYQTRSWNDASMYTGCTKNELSFFFSFCKLSAWKTDSFCTYVTL